MANKKSTMLRKAGFSAKQLIIFAFIFGLAGGYLISRSFAAGRSVPGTCSFANNVVSATGLPNDTVVNFFVTNNTTGAKDGWVLGITHDGTWKVDVAAPTTSTTYDFTSKTWGHSGSKFNVYAECSTSV
jgi:hypothetical protein